MMIRNSCPKCGGNLLLKEDGNERKKCRIACEKCNMNASAELISGKDLDEELLNEILGSVFNELTDIDSDENEESGDHEELLTGFSEMDKEIEEFNDRLNTMVEKAAEMEMKFERLKDRSLKFVSNAKKIVNLMDDCCECEKKEVSAVEYKQGLYNLIKSLKGVYWEAGAKIMEYISSHKIVLAEE